jgi:hypothetical protein
VQQFGDTIDAFDVGPVRVTVRYSCVRRDQYELVVRSALPAELMERLAKAGSVRGSPALYVIDVPAAYQLTVAAGAGRIVLMPRLTTERAAQRAHALDVAHVVANACAAQPTER